MKLPKYILDQVSWYQYSTSDYSDSIVLHFKSWYKLPRKITIEKVDSLDIELTERMGKDIYRYNVHSEFKELSLQLEEYFKDK